MTISTQAPSAPAGGASPCSKCGENPRAARGSWCGQCRRDYAKEHHEKNRPRERIEEDTPCAREECDQTFTWRSTHKGQKFCSRACYMKERNATKKVEKRYLTPAAKATRRRADFRRRGYGITPEDFDAVVMIAGSVCRICTKVATLVPDHDHATDEFRGAICEACNHLLGKAYDDPEILERAALYLRRLV